MSEFFLDTSLIFGDNPEALTRIYSGPSVEAVDPQERIQVHSVFARDLKRSIPCLDRIRDGSLWLAGLDH